MARRFLVLLVCAAVVLPASVGFAATINQTIVNDTSKPWYGYHFQFSNVASNTIAISAVDVYNVQASSPKWKYYLYVQGHNSWNGGGILLFPTRGTDTKIDPGEQLRVNVTYSVYNPDTGVPYTGGMTVQMWPKFWSPDETVATVTPDNMESLGWSFATNVNGKGRIVPYGSSVWDTYCKEGPFITESENTDLGTGAAYITSDYAGYPSPGVDTPSTTWLGLDKWNGMDLAGIALNRITELSYYCFTGKIPTTHKSTNWDKTPSGGNWIYPRIPITLNLTIQEPGNPANRKQLWYRPWEVNKVRGDDCGRNCKRWIQYDCVHGQPYVMTCSRWYSFEEDILQEEIFPTWTDVINKYGTWVLIPTSTDAWPTGWKSAGWDNTTTPQGEHTCTATGKCLNFEVGARKSWTRIYLEEAGINWCIEAVGFQGQVDWLTLGIDGTNVTYNFEPPENLPRVKTVAMNDRAMYDKVLGSNYLHYDSRGWSTNHQIRICPELMNYYPTKLFGKIVTKKLWMLNLDDGTGLVGPHPDGGTTSFAPRVCLVRNNYNTDEAPGAVGQWWCAWGWLEYGLSDFANMPQPCHLWANTKNVVKLWP